MKTGMAILFCMVFLCLAGCAGQADVQNDYFHEINSLIKDEEFVTARAEEGKIVLFDAENCLTHEIAFAGYRSNMDLLYIRKENAMVYFVTGRAVDDETGILFINDESNRLFDGLKTLERVGGNAYQYDTAN